MMSDNINEKNAENNSQSKNKKIAKVILVIIAVLMIIFGSVSFGIYLYNQYSADTGDEELSTVINTTQEASGDEEQVQNPIDFDALQEKNDEIYAWIKVPGTKVDYPIVQSADDDEFYLKHDALTKKWQANGAVYTEMSNHTDFYDPITVIYGHNGYSDSMFTTLHKFEKKSFFDEHEYFYIYTPDSKLTYQIISAFKYDDRHIMNSFDFNDITVLENFQANLINPKSNNKNVRDKLDKTITRLDNIVILSTCITNQKSSRYLVCGVLINNEKTN